MRLILTGILLTTFLSCGIFNKQCDHPGYTCGGTAELYSTKVDSIYNEYFTKDTLNIPTIIQVDSTLLDSV